MGAGFLTPKSGHRREKQPGLGPAYTAIDKVALKASLFFPVLECFELLIFLLKLANFDHNQSTIYVLKKHLLN